jgi:hypothetical protein
MTLHISRQYTYDGPCPNPAEVTALVDLANGEQVGPTRTGTGYSAALTDAAKVDNSSNSCNAATTTLAPSG